VSSQSRSGPTLATGLVTWFRANARPLPWRREPRDPYHVLVSELMLQQTQVERVVPRFLELLDRFPDLETLAAASEDEVVELWSGLGYYRRARMLHRLARQVVERGGSIPGEPGALCRLPGVGPYTAAAVASLAFGVAEPVLDGNVLRVGARVLALDEDPRSAAGRRRLGEWVRGLMAGIAPGEVNEALMELGATVCHPSSPQCPGCPLAAGCRALASGRVGEYPRPRARRQTEDVHWVAVCAVDRERRWLLRRVEHSPILEGLWLPPLADAGGGRGPQELAVALLPVEPLGAARELGPVRHGITHRRITVTPVLVAVEPRDLDCGTWRWVDPSRPGLPTSSLLGKLVRAVGEG